MQLKNVIKQLNSKEFRMFIDKITARRFEAIQIKILVCLVLDSIIHDYFSWNQLKANPTYCIVKYIVLLLLMMLTKYAQNKKLKT